jgi:hypothetical protein
MNQLYSPGDLVRFHPHSVGSNNVYYISSKITVRHQTGNAICYNELITALIIGINLRFKRYFLDFKRMVQRTPGLNNRQEQFIIHRV